MQPTFRKHTHYFIYFFLDFFFTFTWIYSVTLSADDWLLKYMTKIRVTTDQRRHSGCSRINQNCRSRLVSHHWSADSEFDALLTELDRNTFEYSVKKLKTQQQQINQGGGSVIEDGAEKREERVKIIKNLNFNSPVCFRWMNSYGEM